MYTYVYIYIYLHECIHIHVYIYILCIYIYIYYVASDWLETLRPADRLAKDLACFAQGRLALGHLRQKTDASSAWFLHQSSDAPISQVM